MSAAKGTSAASEAATTDAPQILLDLLAARGPSGYESAPAAVWLAAAGEFAQTSSDVIGTPLARVASEARLRGTSRGACS